MDWAWYVSSRWELANGHPFFKMCLRERDFVSTYMNDVERESDCIKFSAVKNRRMCGLFMSATPFFHKEDVWAIKKMIHPSNIFPILPHQYYRLRQRGIEGHMTFLDEGE